VFRNSMINLNVVVLNTFTNNVHNHMNDFNLMH